MITAQADKNRNTYNFDEIQPEKITKKKKKDDKNHPNQESNLGQNYERSYATATPLGYTEIFNITFNAVCSLKN